MENKKIIEVDRTKFIDWYYSSEEDIKTLGWDVHDHLKESDDPYQTTAHEILNCGIGYLPLGICITTKEEILSMGFHIDEFDEIQGFDKLQFARNDK